MMEGRVLGTDLNFDGIETYATRKVKILFGVKAIYYQSFIYNLPLKFHLCCIL